MLNLYSDSLALLTDLYQLTMANGYWHSGVHNRRATFSLFFRCNPFDGGYAVVAGLPLVLDYLENLHFADDDVDYLRTLKGNDGDQLLDDGFLDMLLNWKFECDVVAIPEGRIAFPYEPLLRITGPVWQCQLLETALLNIVNFQSLIATKASRITRIAGSEPVLEFGLRRAQGIDGGVSASRAAYVGGCAATSNVLAGKLFGIPVSGTHAHSWVMFFEDETYAFEQYAEAMPNNCVFLVDTYNTISGIENAIKVGKELRKAGHEMVGIRLDSGDLAYLSIRAREMLDAGGFPDAKVIASSSIDEHVISSLHQQGAKIAVWGVGTRLSTAYDTPALGGVYKMTAHHDENGEWKYSIKLSELAAKVTNPGLLQVRRFTHHGEYVGDVIYDELQGVSSNRLIDPMDATRRKNIPKGATYEDLLVPVFKDGKRLPYDASLDSGRQRRDDDLRRFHAGITRLLNPHTYPVGLEPNLHQTKTDLILRAREKYILNKNDQETSN